MSPDGLAVMEVALLGVGELLSHNTDQGGLKVRHDDVRLPDEIEFGGPSLD